MNDKEKVIAAIECYQNKTPGDRCKTCPYGYGYLDDTGDNSPFWWCSIHKIIDDAAELLKEKLPYVLTLDELKQKQHNESVWLEYKGKSFINNETNESSCTIKIIFGDIDYSSTIPTWKSCRLILFESVGRIDPVTSEDYWPKTYFEQEDDYNKKWRCWNIKPTLEQIKKAPWGLNK